MHDLGTVISAIGGLIGALAVAYQAWGNHKSDYIKTLQDEIKQKQADSDEYRGRWLKAEQGFDDLQKKNRRLENEIDKLKERK